MGTWKRFQHWITGRADSELDCEIRAHLELEAEDQHGSGTPSGQAGYAAHRNFGNRLSIKEDVRAAWGWGLYESLAQDFRYALRAIRKSPGFSTVATVSLALGIGANTAIFTFVNAALLKPLPYPNADRIVALAERSPQGGNTSLVHPQSFVEWLKRARSFEALAIAQAVPINTQGGKREPPTSPHPTQCGKAHVRVVFLEPPKRRNIRFSTPLLPVRQTRIPIG